MKPGVEAVAELFVFHSSNNICIYVECGGRSSGGICYELGAKCLYGGLGTGEMRKEFFNRIYRTRSNVLV